MKRSLSPKCIVFGLALLVVFSVQVSCAFEGNEKKPWEHRTEDRLRSKFQNPPDAARPYTYLMLLNGYVDRDHIKEELKQYRDTGIAGLCVFDLGAGGRESARPPAGPAFMSEESVGDLAHIIRTAGKLDMNVQLSVTSSWDMGGSWVEPRHASMGLYHEEMTVEGPDTFDEKLPFPRVPEKAPDGPDGKPAFWKDVAVLAIPEPQRMPGHDFIFKLDPPGGQTLDRVVFHNVEEGTTIDGETKARPANGVSIAVSSNPPGRGTFRTILDASLKPKEGPQSFDVDSVDASYVRLRVRNGHDSSSEKIHLAEFEVFSKEGINVVASHQAVRQRDGSKLVRVHSASGKQGAWSASNLHDGARKGSGGVWASGGPPPPLIEDREAIVDLTDKVGSNGRLQWEVPDGEWLIQRFVCANTGERLKVPGPNSDGLATDHFNEEATKHFLNEFAGRMRNELGDLGTSALNRLYLASYEVRGATWTPDFLEEFEAYRGYEMNRFLPVLTGAVVENREVTGRFRHDYRKTLGDLLVDAYYRAAQDTAERHGLGVEAEAGGPGPPIHQVPVDALEALGAIDGMRGEFWPHRPDADGLWVVKETASAAHVYGREQVHMESFTSFHHWQDAPVDLKPSADRALGEGANHFVWHTSAHQPPDAGQPGWVYMAGTHLTPNLIWWPMASSFIDYLSRCSYLLQQGRFVADVCYYYGNKGFNFVPPKHRKFSPGYGYDYDVINKEVLLERMETKNGRLTLPDGPRYEILVLPDQRRIDPQVLKKVDTLVENGATVVGPKPTGANGLSGHPERSERVKRVAEHLWEDLNGDDTEKHQHGRGTVIRDRPPRDVLNERGVPPDFGWSGPGKQTDVDYIHRRTEDAEIYFVHNRTDQFKRIEATFRVTGDRAPEIWSPSTGTVRSQYVYQSTPHGVEVPLTLYPHGSTFVVFRRPADSRHPVSLSPSRSKTKNPSRDTKLVPSARVVDVGDKRTRLRVFAPGRYRVEWNDGREDVLEVSSDRIPDARQLTGSWTVHFQSGRGAPETVRFPRLRSWTEHDSDGVRYYSGIGRYEKTFDVPGEWLKDHREVFLDLGDLWAVGRVTVNGTDLGVVWTPPYRVDVTSALRPGSNRLEVEIANTWSNRLVGDARTKGKDFTRTNVQRTNGVAWKEVDLIESGLFGPVRLFPAAVLEAD